MRCKKKCNRCNQFLYEFLVVTSVSVCMSAIGMSAAAQAPSIGQEMQRFNVSNAELVGCILNSGNAEFSTLVYNNDFHSIKMVKIVQYLA